MIEKAKAIDLLVVGAGPAGLAAAIAAKKAGVMDLMVLEREEEPGGILNQCIHNGFGLHRFREELTGPEYAQRDIREARDLGIPVRCGTMVLDITPDKEVTLVSREKGLEIFRARAVILAMGCRERPRGALAIPGTRPAGVFSAGTAQKIVNMMGYMPGHDVVILGSGDIGLIMARRMTLQGAKVRACVELMPYSSGLNRNIVQCLDDYEIPLMLSHTVIDVKGRGRVESVTIARVGEDRLPIPGTEQEIPCDTLLLSVGLIPENELSLGIGVTISATTQGPVVDNRFQTNVPGVFACGNVLHVHDLVDFVSAESTQAGEAAARYLGGYEDTGATEVRVVDGPGIRGTVPQRLLLPQGEIGEGLEMMFRPDRVYNNCFLTIKAGEAVLVSQRRRILTPGEMATAKLSPQLLETLRNEKELRLEITAEKQVS
ncbi:MAG: FAD-dependent oxidoreductase [Eubacteriales bacterium]|jgi:sarcosine oxidase subunit alpha|nr:FAD-dependent oxidoreductase [Eubacteriales bacterium]MDD3572401.1 FAD-dependent oxidoreductase [Eubacteriales bacterium]MDD4135188.1 FAD-dependent oxidoreductase [Eubacteriales bacterium]NLO13877.1 FAD-dependent oxidoreductase [Clostridiales bacterium]